MEYITTTLANLVHQTAFFSLTWGNLIMIGVACFFLFLAIRHGFEPLLLVPIAFGMLLVNIYPDMAKFLSAFNVFAPTKRLHGLVSARHVGRHDHGNGL